MKSRGYRVCIVTRLWLMIHTYLLELANIALENFVVLGQKFD